MSRCGFLLPLLTACLCAGASAQQPKARNTHFGLKGIIQMPGDAYVEEADAFFDIDMGFGVGGLVDTRLGEKLLGGVFLDALNVSAYDESAMMVDVGAALKAVLGGGGTSPTWRPGIGVGYGMLGGVGALESTHYLTLRGTVEAVLPSGWVAEAVLYGSPTGGNSDVTVSWGPLFQLRFGRIF